MIREAIDEYGRGVGVVFKHDRSKTVGASEIGLCARRTAFTKRGLKASGAPKRRGKKLLSANKTPQQKRGDKRGASQLLESNWGAHVRGTVIERELWYPAMSAKFGKDFKMAGKFQQTLTDGYLSATPDGVVVNRGHEILKMVGVKDYSKYSKTVAVECKSIDPRVNLTEEKSENAFQVQVQMGLLRKLTPYKPDWAVISYVDASFWHEVAEFAVPFRQDDFEAAQMRAAKILNADPQDLRPEGWISGGKECGWCPWARECAELRGGVPPNESQDGVTTQLKAEIIDLAKQANAAQIEEAAAAARKRDFQDQIKDRLREKNVRKIPGVVNWYNVKGRDGLDIPALEEECKKRGIDLDKFRTTGDPTNTLAVDKKVVLL